MTHNTTIHILGGCAAALALWLGIASPVQASPGEVSYDRVVEPAAGSSGLPTNAEIRIRYSRYAFSDDPEVNAVLDEPIVRPLGQQRPIAIRIEQMEERHGTHSI